MMQKIKNEMTFAEKVELGLQLAYEKLVKQEAKEGRSLVFSIDGKITHIPASELLLQLQQQGKA